MFIRKLACHLTFLFLLLLSQFFTPSACASSFPLQTLIEQRNFLELGIALEEALASQEHLETNISDLFALQRQTDCQELERALQAVSAIQKLDNVPLSAGSLIRIALYIETTFSVDKARGDYILPKEKSGLAKSIEYDPESGYTFIHLSDNDSDAIGIGRHKIVLKSLLYHIIKPEILARCIMKGEGNQREVAVLKHLDGDEGLTEVRAIILRGYIEGRSQYEIFLRFYNAGSLSRFIGTKKHTSLSLRSRLRLARDMIQGIGNMHMKNYVHRDLHCGNFFLHKEKDPLTGKYSLHAVVGDYGKTLNTRNCIGIVSQPVRYYRAPESIIYKQLKGSQYLATDIYAIGCVFYRLLFNSRPPWSNTKIIPSYRQNEPIEKLREIQSTLHSHIQMSKARAISNMRKKLAKGQPLNLEDEVKCLIFDMVHVKSHKRPTAQEVQRRLEELLQES